MKCFSSVFSLILLAFIWPTFASDCGSFMEKVSGSDLLDLLEKCDSETAIWTFNTMKEQKPLFSAETKDDCLNRLRHNSFFWAPIDDERINMSNSSGDHVVFYREVGSAAFEIGTDSQDSHRPFGDVFYKYLIEISAGDYLENVKLRSDKNLKTFRDIDRNGQRRHKKGGRKLCFDFEGPARLSSGQRKVKRHDFCINEKEDFHLKARTMIADVEIPVKSGAIEATIVVPAIVRLMHS